MFSRVSVLVMLSLTLDHARAWARGFYHVLQTYYTNWTLLAFLLLQLGYLHSCATRTVFMMLVTSAVGGFYMAHVYPRRLVVRNVFPIDIVVKGSWLQAGDILTHQLPLWYFLLDVGLDNDNNNAKSSSSLPYLCVTAFWFLGNDPREQYNVRTWDVLVIFSVTQLIFFLV